MSYITINGSEDNEVDLEDVPAGIAVTFNGKAGVGLETVDPSLPPSFHNIDETISGNSIYANGGLGIDLGNDGVTPNNPAGSPTGPNRLQPYPVLNSATPAPGGGLR